MAKYQVRTPCEVLGVWRDKGVPFDLTDDQATYLTPPHGNVILPVSSASDVKKERNHGRINRD